MMMNVNPVDATADEPLDRYIYTWVCANSQDFPGGERGGENSRDHL